MTKSKFFTVAGFLLAPLVVAFFMSLLTPVTNDGPVTPFGMLNNDTVALFGLTLAFYCYTLPLSAIFAVPTFVLLRRFNLVRWWSATLAGAVIGGACAFLFTLDRLLRTHNLKPELPGYLNFGVMGAVGAITFWLVWRLGQNSQA